MHFIRSAWLGLPVAALLLACSGQIEIIGGKGDGGGGGGDGGDESIPLPRCPDPSQVGSNTSCAVDGQQCRSAQMASCDGGVGDIPIECTCAQGTWGCVSTSPGCGPLPQPSCPFPGAVVGGGLCSVDPTLSCQSDTPVPDCDGGSSGNEYCNCVSGSWECLSTGTPVCVGDAGGVCPSPFNVFAGATCFGPNLECPGNPQTCFGGTVYDAFVCENGIWVDVAPTICDADGGPDAGPPGDGGGWDGPSVD